MQKIIYPWDNIIVINENPKQIGARNCIVKEITLEQTDNFLNLYHYQKSCFGQEIRLGLFYSDILIGVMTFGKARFTEKAQWELLRLCYHPDYKVMGGSNKLFNTFIKTHTPNSVISYCDRSKFSGEVYTKLGMKQIQYGRPRKHYWRESDKKHFTAQFLLNYGADKLLGTSYGKGTDNEEIVLKEGFKIIKDEGQDVYLYLDENQYFGYIYMTTDLQTGKRYIGQHVSSKFDPKYFGSGQILRHILKTRPETIKVEVLEWCKQDISDREIYYIEKYNTMYPNGYNLTTRKQWFSFSEPENISMRVKKFYQTEKGKEVKEKNRLKNIEFYKSEKGKQTLKVITEKRKAHFATEEGKKQREAMIKHYSEFCKTEAGQKMCKERNRKLRELNKTEAGKEKEKLRIQALRDFYASEEGKKARAAQIAKAKENLKKPEYQKRRKACAKRYSEWAKTPEGKAKLAAGAQKTKAKLIAGYIERVNAMSEKEWQEFLIKHPKTTLIKYRKK